MVKGIDVSHHNRESLIKLYLEQNTDTQFMIAKATEGKTFIDRQYTANREIAKKYRLLFGAYHYARPENNEPREEAANFLTAINYNGENMLLALDWEGTALSYDLDWAIKWLDYVYDSTGIKPLFYCSQTFVKNCEKISKKDYGLWAARYNSILGSVKPWETYAIWQKNCVPLDMDVFNGTFEQLMQYATPKFELDSEQNEDFKQELYAWIRKWEETH